jgi:hypothetical protein
MIWIKRLVAKWARQGSQYDEEHDVSAKMSTGTDNDEFNDSIRFYLTSAVGGRILKVIREPQNNHSNRHSIGYQPEVQLYVIPSGEDVGQRVAKIINLEMLK